MTAKEFLEKYRSLCHESGFCLISEDPYDCLVLSKHDPSSDFPDEVLDIGWIERLLDDFNS